MNVKKIRIITSVAFVFALLFLSNDGVCGCHRSGIRHGNCCSLSPDVKINSEIFKDSLAESIELLRYKRISDLLLPHGPALTEVPFLTVPHDIQDINIKLRKLLSDYPDIYYAPFFASFLGANLPVRKGDKLLDYGCGSGVISFYAVWQGAGDVLAIDSDALCCDFVRENSFWFDVRGVVRVLQSDGYKNIPDGERFNTIVSFPPIYSEDDVDSGAMKDHNGKFIENLLSGAAGRLLPGGRVVILHPDNPTAIDRLSRLCAKNGLIVTERKKFGTEEIIMERIKRKFPDKFNEAGMNFDKARELLAKEGLFTWSVFVFEKIEDISLEKKIDWQEIFYLEGMESSI